MSEDTLRGSSADINSPPLKLAVLRRVVMPYRLGLLKEIGGRDGIQLKVFHGEDVPNSKVRNSQNISGFDSLKLPTRFFKFGKLSLARHQGLSAALAEFQPDVILCEGESNLLSYLMALNYKRRHPQTAVVLWSLVWLIGKPLWSNPLSYLYKRLVHHWFDAFVAFSSYSRDVLIQLGRDPKRIVVATNVADTTKHLFIADNEAVSKVTAREKLGLPDGFTILYSGTIDKVKKPGVLIEVARSFADEDVNFVFLGRGPLLEAIRSEARAHGLKRVFVPGFVEPDQVPLYYFSSDVLAVPGRGGMVISEAMAYGLPVIVHQADGTEVDLVENDATGYRLDSDAPEGFEERIRTLLNDPDLVRRLGEEGRIRARNRFTTAETATRIIEAVTLAHSIRNSSG